MATGRVPTTANSPLTAKGDLFGYSTTQARVAVGNNGETLVADSSTSTGLRYQGSIAGGKNFAINGGMDIWQRGTSFSVTGAGYNAYTADRWTCYSSSTGTVSQDTSLSASGFRYGLKFTSSASAVGFSFFQMVETNQTIPLAGQQVALSGYNVATAGKSISLNLEYSTTVDDYLFGTWVQATKTTISQPTSTGSLLRYTYSFAIPTTAKSLRITLGNGSLNNTEFSTWTGVQLELGSVPTAFSRAGGTIQGELAACCYYYERLVSDATYNSFGAGFFTSGSRSNNNVNYQRKRVVPSIAFSNVGSWFGSGSIGAASIASSYIGKTSAMIDASVTGASQSVGAGAMLCGNNNTAAYIEVSAEL